MAKKTTVGGMALIEGLMMMGPEASATAIRKPDGEIVTEKKPLPKFSTNKFYKLFIIRGIVNFFRQMIIGMKAMMYSAEFVDIEDDESDEEQKQSWFDAKLEKMFKNNKEKMMTFLIYFSVIISLCFSVGLFMLLPNFIAGFLPEGISRVWKNLLEGGIRIGLFIGYLSLTSVMKDIQRVWQYHGAEHKTIFCYEAGEFLTIANVRKYSRLHPRCGTSFLFIVMIVSILVFSLLPWLGPVWNILMRLALVPFVAGLSYELLRFVGRSDNAVCKVVRKPGMWLQKLTTREPDDAQIAVAIEAIKLVIPEDNSDEW